MFSLTNINELPQWITPLTAADWFIIDVPDGSSPTGFKSYKVNTSFFSAVNSIYSADDIVGSGRIATLTDTLEFLGGRVRLNNSALTSILNATNVIEVTTVADFPTAVGGVITLDASTTYVIRGIVAVSDILKVDRPGISIQGINRTRDGLTYNGTDEMINVEDASLTISNLRMIATDTNGKIMTANNHTIGDADNNYGRTEVLEITNCEIRNTTNVWTITGFELVDISNTLVWYITGGTSQGCQFQSVRHLEITSCEFYNWYEEGTNPASNYSTLDQIEILANLDATVPVNPTPIGNGVVNINSSMIHPEITQDGLKISATSTTGFGTIASNTLVDTNLTTGLLANFDYDVQNTYIIQANQGIGNGNAKGTMSLTSNIVLLDNSVTNPITLADASTVGGGGFTNPITFSVATRILTDTTTGQITYQNKISANFFVTVSATVGQAGNGFITLRLRSNGTPLTHSVGYVQIRSGNAETVTFSVIGQATLGDVFDIEVESSNGTDVLVSELVLNGYQF